MRGASLSCPLVAAFLIATGAAAARADTLASAMGGAATANQAVCFLANIGTSALTVSNASIVRDDRVSLTLAFNDCGTSLAAGRTCYWRVNLSNVTSLSRYACRTFVSSKADVRGALNLRRKPKTGDPILLLALPMR